MATIVAVAVAGFIGYCLYKAQKKVAGDDIAKMTGNEPNDTEMGSTSDVLNDLMPKANIKERLEEKLRRDPKRKGSARRSKHPKTMPGFTLSD